MRLRIVLIVFSFVLALLVPAAASAGTLDQQQTNSTTGSVPNGAIWLAQGFTPTLNGQLDRVDLSLNRIGTPAGGLTVQIWTVAGGLPSSPIPGASATVPLANIPMGTNWVQVPISAPSVAGTQYAIVVANPAGSLVGCPAGGDLNCLRWREDDSNPYPDPSYLSSTSGASWAPQARDFAFKTYVATPSDQLSALLAEVNGLDPKIKGLAKKLKRAQEHLAENETNHACKDLSAFIKQIGDEKEITHAEAASLITQANNIMAALGC